MGALGMTKKGTNKHINSISVTSSLYEIQKKLHFAEPVISLEAYDQYNWKISSRRDSRNINT